ncbi:MAG: hypothetical protein P8127_17820, partial [Acidobacteriota bacterium]
MVSLNGRAGIETRIVMKVLANLDTTPRGIWRGTLVAPLLLAPTGLLHAGTSELDFQHAPDEYWAARILSWTLILAVVFVAYSLVKAIRGRLVGISGKALMMLGVVLLPSFSVTIGMLLVFTRAERVEFCASCHHVMQEYADDLTNPEGAGLAAIHY